MYEDVLDAPDWGSTNGGDGVERNKAPISTDRWVSLESDAKRTDIEAHGTNTTRLVEPPILVEVAVVNKQGVSRVS